jgi:hypothetical protein
MLCFQAGSCSKFCAVKMGGLRSINWRSMPPRGTASIVAFAAAMSEYSASVSGNIVSK